MEDKNSESLANTSHKISRRDFLKLSSFLLSASAVASSCVPLSPTQDSAPVYVEKPVNLRLFNEIQKTYNNYGLPMPYSMQEYKNYALADDEKPNIPSEIEVHIDSPEFAEEVENVLKYIDGFFGKSAYKYIHRVNIGNNATTNDHLLYVPNFSVVSHEGTHIFDVSSPKTNDLNTVLSMELQKAEIFCYTDMGIQLGPSSRGRFLKPLGRNVIENTSYSLNTSDTRLIPLKKYIEDTSENELIFDQQGNLIKELADKISEDPNTLYAIGEKVLEVIKPDPESFSPEFKNMVVTNLRSPQLVEGHAVTIEEMVPTTPYDISKSYWEDTRLAGMTASYISLALGENLDINQIRSNLVSGNPTNIKHRMV